MKKKVGVILAALLAATLGAGAQSIVPACNSFNSCFVFSTSGNGTFQVAAIPAGATTINVQIVVATGAVTSPFTAQIQTASSLTSGTTLASPASCGSSATVGTSAGAYTLTCTLSSSQPWGYVGVNLTGGTGATSGDFLSFSSALVGLNAGINISTAQCLAYPVGALTRPCVAYSGSFTGLGASGTTGTITLYSGNAPASGEFEFCGSLAVSTAGSAGTAAFAVTYTTPGGLVQNGAWLISGPLNSTGMQNAVCVTLATQAGSSLSFVVSAQSATGSPVWETEPIVIRLL